MFGGEQGELAAFDLATATWRRLLDLPAGFDDLEATVLAEGLLMIIGGTSTPYPVVIGDGRAPWMPGPPLPARADSPLLASLPDGRVVAVGGFQPRARGFASDATWVYDARTERWTAGAKLPTPIWTGDAFAAGADVVVIARMPDARPRAYTYNASADTWTVTDAGQDHDGFAMVRLHDGRIALVGGSVPDVPVIAPTRLYVPATRQFDALPGLPEKR